jgi:heme/copper-type cytochrome/quinol oxidase subunit 3
MTSEPVTTDRDPLSQEPPGFHETPEEIEYEMRSAEGAMWTGGRLVIGITAFFFASLAFAYFYLRSTNSDGLWRPHKITAPTGVGSAIFAVALASALLSGYGTMRLRRGETLDWEVAGWTTVFGGLVAIGLQVWQLTQLPFFPGSSGYASCFVAWAGMNIALLLVGVYWLETLLARWLRLRRAVTEDGGALRSTLPVARLFRANLEACSYFWGFIALVDVLFWLLFYVI